MSTRKLDGVIEAVRYNTDGKIILVRAYERRGAVWTDRLLLERNDLTGLLSQGKRFAIGERKSYNGSVFNTSRLVCQSDGKIITEGEVSAHDFLSGVPVF
jgi:hypothetical protein